MREDEEEEDALHQAALADPALPVALENAAARRDHSALSATALPSCRHDDGVGVKLPLRDGPPWLYVPQVDHRAPRFWQLLLPALVLVAAVYAVTLQLQSPHQPHHPPTVSGRRSNTGGEHMLAVPSSRPVVAAAASAVVVPATAPPPLTLRRVLLDATTGFHLALAPAFFGFSAYFGALAAWFDAAGGGDNTTNSTDGLPIRSVAGASAGAMAALLLAAGVPPTRAADFCAGITLADYADFPGFGAFFRGNKFEALVHEFLQTSAAEMALGPAVLHLRDARLPVAVTAFDVQTMRVKILTTGSVARAARASATFPGLFQPVGWDDGDGRDSVLIDGGVVDTAGLLGLTHTMRPLPPGRGDTGVGDSQRRERVINLCAGSFRQSPPLGPSSLPGNPEVISISLRGLPQPGPWAMRNGPLAFAAARTAMAAALDEPLERVVVQKRGGTKYTSDVHGEEPVHYELVIRV